MKRLEKKIETKAEIERTQAIKAKAERIAIV